MPAALAGNGPTRANALTPAANAGLGKVLTGGREADSHGLQLGQTSHKSNGSGVPGALDATARDERRGYGP